MARHGKQPDTITPVWLRGFGLRPAVCRVAPGIELRMHCLTVPVLTELCVCAQVEAALSDLIAANIQLSKDFFVLQERQDHLQSINASLMTRCALGHQLPLFAVLRE